MAVPQTQTELACQEQQYGANVQYTFLLQKSTISDEFPNGKPAGDVNLIKPQL
jgi:hypothetical protein